jgi:hypothetical protein
MRRTASLPLFLLSSALLVAATVSGAAEKVEPAESAVWKPTEPADAVLHGEKMSWSRHLHDALRLPEWFDLAAEHRTRFEFLDDAWRPGESKQQTQIVQRNRFRIGADAPAGIRFLAELQDARVFNDRPRDFRASIVNHLDVLQLFVSATGTDLFGRGLRADAHVGRMTIDVGSRRLVARNDFRNTVNAFDGVHLQLGSDDRKWRVRGFYTFPVAIRNSDLMNDRLSTRRRFAGLVFEDLRNPWAQLDAYGLFLDDLPGNRSFRTWGLRAYRRPAPAQVDYEGDFAAQFGDRKSASQGTRDQQAFMLHAELGYTFGSAWSPRVAFQLDWATGNDDPSDDDAHAFDPLFGARRFDLMPTGIFGPFRRTNILSPGVRFGLQPTKTVRLDLKVRHWRLDEGRDTFAGSTGPGGATLSDPSGDAGRDLGTDLELRARWQAREWLDFDLGYDHWWKGRFLDDVAATQTRGDADYFYVQSRMRF